VGGIINRINSCLLRKIWLISFLTKAKKRLSKNPLRKLKKGFTSLLLALKAFATRIARLAATISS